jgi:hypothetical protein
MTSGNSDEKTQGRKGNKAQRRVWIWALRPLERDHTPNMYCSISDPPGSIVQMLHDERTGAAVPSSSAYDAGVWIPETRRRTLAEVADNAPPPGGWRIWYRYYRPTDADVAILRAAYPEDDPYNPNWLNIKRDLALAGIDPETLSKIEAPVLLGLLGKAKAAPAASNRKRIGFGPQD